MKPQKFMVTVKSPNGHGNYQDVIQKEIQMWFRQRWYDNTNIVVEEIFEEEIKKNDKLEENQSR